MPAERVETTNDRSTCELVSGRDRAQIGPFVAAGHPFLIESTDADLISKLADCVRDLRFHGAPVDPTVFTIECSGPRWMTHPWGLWRDGEPCETTVTDSYIAPYVLWEVTRLVLEHAVAPTIPVHAAALVRDDKAIVLCGPSYSGKSTLAAWLTHRGWGFLTDEVGLLDTTDSTTTLVRPFWRPVGVRRGGPIDTITELVGDEPEVLVPASELGSLGEAAPLVALVCPSYSKGASGELVTLSPAAALAVVAEQLPSLAREGASVFRSLATIVTQVPAYALSVEDLDRAEATLATIVDGLSSPKGSGTPG